MIMDAAELQQLKKLIDEKAKQQRGRVKSQ